MHHSALRKRNITTHLVSGDNDAVVQSVAKQLCIFSSDVRSECSPADKQSYIKILLSSTNVASEYAHRSCRRESTRLQRRYTFPKTPTVLFCGDGTNDAPALARTTVGIHVSSASGTDISSAAADVVLVKPNLLNVLAIIGISAAVMRRIYINFAWGRTISSQS